MKPFTRHDAPLPFADTPANEAKLVRGGLCGRFG
jgi:hypothetical protein